MSSAADWTNLVSDPDLINHLGELLQTYREASPENRNDKLLEAMRRIKRTAASQGHPAGGGTAAAVAQAPEPVAPAPISAPPIGASDFVSSAGQDRRAYPRLKCYVAVELRMSGSETSIWGNLANTSIGGALVETATPIVPGSQLEIGLWLASGKIWVKGLVLNGVVTSASPSFGIRIKFSELPSAGRETLRQFLRFIEAETKGFFQQNGYLARLKR